MTGSAEVTMGCAAMALGAHYLPYSIESTNGNPVIAVWETYSASASYNNCPARRINICEPNRYQFSIVLCDPSTGTITVPGKVIVNPTFNCESYVLGAGTKSCFGVYAVVLNVSPQTIPPQYGLTDAVQLSVNWREGVESPYVSTCRMNWVGSAAWLEDPRSDASVVFPTGGFTSRDRVLLIPSNQTI